MKTRGRKPIVAPALLTLLALGLQPSRAIAMPTVAQIAAGSQFGLFTMSDGSLWGMGANGAGELGLGSQLPYTNVPVQILSSGVTGVSAGQSFSLFRMSNGSLWGMGNDYDGQLGDGTFFINKYVPEQIVSATVNAFAAGGSHTLFGEWRPPVGRGSLWTMGDNEHGQLGDGTITTTNTPQEILSTVAVGSPAVTAVAGGSVHSLFIKPGGGLWAMGYNVFGQLGDGTINDQHVPEQIVASGVVAIAAGFAHSLFIKSDGSLWGIGYNSLGELGDGTINEQHVPEQIVPGNVVAIAAGEESSLFIKSDGSLWGMGDNGWGQLGIGSAISQTAVPIQAVASNVVAIACGGSHSLFIKADGSLWTMGFNSVGELGDPRVLTNVATPIRIVPPTPILNAGFEMGDFIFWATNGNVSETHVTAKRAYVHSGQYGAQFGPAGSLGYLSQTLVTVPGTTYLFAFWLYSPDGETPNEFRVSWNGTVLFDQTNIPATGWTNIVLQVTAAGARTALQFGFRNDNSYFGLDDISLVPLVPPVITGISLAAPNVALTAGNGQAGGIYLTLTSTNLSLPLGFWTRVATNVLNEDGNFTVSTSTAVIPQARQQFYILQMLNQGVQVP